MFVDNYIYVGISIVVGVAIIMLLVRMFSKKETFNSPSKSMTFQQKAADVIGNVAFPNFYNCIKTDPNTCLRTDQILSIRDNLDILNFAYFPLNNATVKYNRINPDGTLKEVTTSDPVTIILYYSAEMYTILGSVEDAVSSNQADPVLEKYRNVLFAQVNYLFADPNMTDGVTWLDYFKYPGPYGTKWGEKIVKWTVDIKNVDKDFKGNLNTALYLNLSPNYPIVTFRQQNSQFWQDHIPNQNTMFYDGLKQLIKIQCDTVIKRYNNLVATDKDGNWDKSILNAGGENIDIYHKLRKSIRSMSRAVENFPEVLNAFNQNVPDDFIKYINTFNQDTPVPPPTPSGPTQPTGAPSKITYKDIILGVSQKYIIGYLFFVNDDRSSFYKLTKLSRKDYNSLRTLVYFKTLRVGYKGPLFLVNLKNGVPANIPTYLKDATFCPSISRSPPMKAELASLDNIPNNVYTYTKPEYTKNAFTGSYCEVDNFMGDIHDYAVLYQKNLDNQEYRNVKDLENYVKAGATSIKNMFKEINLPKVVKNLKSAM